MLTFFFGLISGLALAWLAEWLLDWRHWRRSRAARARTQGSDQ